MFGLRLSPASSLVTTHSTTFVFTRAHSELGQRTSAQTPVRPVASCPGGGSSPLRCKEQERGSDKVLVLLYLSRSWSCPRFLSGSEPDDNDGGVFLGERFTAGADAYRWLFFLDYLFETCSGASSPRPARPPPSSPAGASRDSPAPRQVAAIRPHTAQTVERRAVREEYRNAHGRINKKRFTCKACDVTCYGEAVWRDHRLSRRHRHKVNPQAAQVPGLRPRLRVLRALRPPHPQQVAPARGA